MEKDWSVGVSPVLENLPELAHLDQFHDVDIFCGDNKLISCHSMFLAAGEQGYAPFSS
jgi:hypothetical protein